MDRNGIGAILAQYRRHGWALRRVLVSASFRERIPDLEEIFNGTEIRTADLDAMWFSRASRPGLTAWEIRRLAELPYALVENIPDNTPEDEVETIIAGVEERLASSSIRTPVQGS